MLLLFFFFGGGGGVSSCMLWYFPLYKETVKQPGVYSKRGTGVLTIYANHPDQNFPHKYKMI